MARAGSEAASPSPPASSGVVCAASCPTCLRTPNEKATSSAQRQQQGHSQTENPPVGTVPSRETPGRAVCNRELDFYKFLKFAVPGTPIPPATNKAPPSCQAEPGGTRAGACGKPRRRRLAPQPPCTVGDVVLERPAPRQFRTAGVPPSNYHSQECRGLPGPFARGLARIG